MQQTFFGIVSSIRRGPSAGDERYVVLSEKAIEAASPVPLSLLDKVKLDCEIDEAGTIEIKSAEVTGKAAGTEHAAALKRILGGYTLQLKKAAPRNAMDFAAGELTDTSKKMHSKLIGAGKRLLSGFVSGVPIIVRFHGDGDGASGAIALYKALERVRRSVFLGTREVRWMSNKGIAYTPESLYYDSMLFRNSEGVGRPLLVLIDFGTTIESNEAIDNADSIADFIWLDHHPVPEGFAGSRLKDYINPLSFGGSSSFTAGYLACIFSESVSGLDLGMLAQASLISDFSAYANRKDAEANKCATVLDFVTGIKDSTHYLDGPITPGYLSRLLDDKEKLDSVYNYAKYVISEAISMGVKGAKSYKRLDGVEVNVIDFEDIAQKFSGYLLPGRYSSQLHGHIDSRSGKGSITIVTFRNIISIRVSKEISAEVGLLGIIGRLKDTTDMVDSGGGHHEAASIRVSEENRIHILRLLLKELGVKS